MDFEVYPSLLQAFLEHFKTDVDLVCCLNFIAAERKFANSISDFYREEKDIVKAKGGAVESALWIQGREVFCTYLARGDMILTRPQKSGEAIVSLTSIAMAFYALWPDTDVGTDFDFKDIDVTADSIPASETVPHTPFQSVLNDIVLAIDYKKVIEFKKTERYLRAKEYSFDASSDEEDDDDENETAGAKGNESEEGKLTKSFRFSSDNTKKMDQLAVTMRTTKRASNVDVKNADGLSADVPVEEIPTVGKFVEAPLLRTLSSPSNQSSAQKASKVACMNALDTINRTCGNPVFHTRGYTSMRLRVLEVKEAGVLVPQTLLWICVDSTVSGCIQY